MLFKGNVLSENERKTIHKESIRILEEVGVKFPCEKALDLLEAGGSLVDRAKHIAYINEAMVTKALELTPKSFILGARNPEMNFALPSTYSSYSLDGCGLNMFDYHTGKNRSSVLNDIADAAKIFEEVKMGTILWPPVVAQDVPVSASGVLAVGTAFMNTSKHIQDEEKSTEEVKYHMQMCKAILGSFEEVKKRKIYSATYCVVSPLTHDKDMMEATMELSNYEAPILCYAVPACGTTGPAGLFSNVALANAEVLSCIVLFQLTNAKTPLIYGSSMGSTNMRNGLFLMGAPESALQLTAMVEMGKYYHLPTSIAGCGSDAKEPGMQTILEKIFTSMPQVMVGSDVIQGIGMFECSLTLSLEQILIDEEIANFTNRLKQGIQSSENKNLFDDIKQVGCGGHYLKRKSTKSLFRSEEHYIPSSLIDRNSYDEWVTLGNPDMFSQAHKKVQQILHGESKNPLPLNVEKEIMEIMEEAKAKL